MRIWLPRVIALPWLLPALEAAILAVLVFGNPADFGQASTLATPN
jgi:hypothetical protein